MNAGLLTLAALALVAGAADGASPAGPVPRTAVVRSMEGARVCPLEATGRAATVLIFIAHDCPICNAYGAEIQRLRDDYGVGRIAFYVVYTDVGIPMTTLQAHARAHGYADFALFDTAHTLVKATGATVTPEVAVLGPRDRIRYEGRIDDRFTGYGLGRDMANVSDLRRALDAIRLGRPIAVARTKAVGCFIPGT